jgi:hypothetical protein
MLMVYTLYPKGTDILDQVFCTCEVLFHLGGSLAKTTEYGVL